MNILISWILSALIIMAGAYFIPGVHVDSFVTALVVALVLGIINAILKPILIFLTLPINILTLGLFTLVINAVLILLTAAIIPGFTIDGFWSAFLFGIVISIFHAFLHTVL